MRRLDPEWAFLKSSANNAEAALTRALLDANGIECVIEGEQLGTILGPIDTSFELRLLVRAHELERAREVLAKAESQAVDEQELAELAVQSAPKAEEPPPAPEAPADPQRKAREKAEREMLRFVAGFLAVLLTGVWLMLRGTGTNLPILLVLVVLCAAIWARLRWAGGR